ncbi:MAG: M23 family metallopeptidase [Clostridiales bacterium]|nr:M23 family metallopeptidase [Clostridiales bacterium]
MKKNSLAEFFKGKGYYVLLFVGIIAIAAVAIIGSNLSSNNDDETEDFVVDLNEPDNNIASEDNNNLQADTNDSLDQVSDQGQGIDVAEGSDDVANNDSLLEYDVYSEEEENGIDLAEYKPDHIRAAEKSQTNTEEETPAVETTGATVQNLPNLSFQVDKGLLWPVEGNVIMNYNVDHLVYHATLMQFKVNPAIIIDAEVGTEVKSAADGVIADIYDDPVTGLTVTMNIGDGYSLLYGQLANVNHKIGDRLSEGDVIGVINEPTKFYSVEGSNLYFMVLEDEETVNPMLLLR